MKLWKYHKLSKDEYTEVINEARNDVKTAYELREKAMESAEKLINTKNPKYIEDNRIS